MLNDVYMDYHNHRQRGQVIVNNEQRYQLRLPRMKRRGSSQDTVYLGDKWFRYQNKNEIILL